jgi:hypothetical protein
MCSANVLTDQAWQRMIYYYMIYMISRLYLYHFSYDLFKGVIDLRIYLRKVCFQYAFKSKF